MTWPDQQTGISKIASCHHLSLIVTALERLDDFEESRGAPSPCSRCAPGGAVSKCERLFSIAIELETRHGLGGLPVTCGTALRPTRCRPASTPIHVHSGWGTSRPNSEQPATSTGWGQMRTLQPSWLNALNREDAGGRGVERERNTSVPPRPPDPSVSAIPWSVRSFSLSTCETRSQIGHGIRLRCWGGTS